MDIFELEKIIEEMRKQYVKNYWIGADEIDDEDLLSIYVLLLMKEENKKRGNKNA